MIVEWRAYDYTDKAGTAPGTAYETVWIYDAFGLGVTTAHWAGQWETTAGNDDLMVTHWAPMEMPEPPPGAEDGD